MKNFKRIVGLFLCLAMVLSFVPASIFPTTVKAATTTTSDILEKIDISGTVVGTCSSPYSEDVSYENQNWYSTQKPEWKNLDKFVNGNISDEITYKVSAGERGDVYLDLTKKNGSAISADQFKLYYGASGSNTTMPAITVVLELANGNEVEETFTTNWSGSDAEDPLVWDFGQTYEIEGIYVYSSTPAGQEKQVSFAEIELYQYIEVPYLETATLNGVDIGQYKIVYSDDDLDYAKTAAEYIQDQILRRTGRQVEIVEDNTAETTYEIQVGNVNRTYAKSISAPGETAMKFTFASNGTKIAMKADYFIIAGAAYYFVETYIGTTDFNVTANTGATIQNTITKPAKNYIFMIGDGMGEMHTKLFDKYGAAPTTGTYGYSDGEDIFYGYYLPYFGWQKTANISGAITDSAAAGTALATGYKTTNGYVGKNQYQQDVKNMSELALERGMSVAVMSTEGVDGATPAAFSAHSDDRYEGIIASQKDFTAKGGLLIDGTNNYKNFTADEFEEWEAQYMSGLNAVSGDADGFFIMYEEAHIDKVSHRLTYDTDLEDLYHTVYRFNQAIANFMEYALYNPDTMVLITADHETAGLDANFEPTVENPEDEQANGYLWNHSLKNVPVFSYGEGAEIFDGVTAENASYARTWANLMTNGEADDFGNPAYPIIGSGESGEVDEGQNFYTDLPEEKSPVDVSTPTFGYYKGDTNGDITEYYNSKYAPENLVDGSADTLTYSQIYTYTEIANGEKIPVIHFKFSEPVNVAGIKLTGYEYGRYNMEDFDIEVYAHDGYSTSWYTAATVRDAFTNGTYDEPVEEPLEIGFHQIRTATEMRIIVKGITNMSAEAQDDATSGELLTGSYIRIREIEVYETDEPTVTPQPTEPADPEETEPQPTTAPTTPSVNPNDPIKQGTILEIVSPKKVTPALGYISVSDPYGTITEPDHSGEATCLTDGMYYKTAYSKCAASASQYVAAAAILSSATTIGGVEINAHRDAGQDPTAFKIVVKQTDGTWKEVANVTSSPFSDSTRTVMYTFDPVVATEVRVLISAHTGEQVYIAELCLYESKTGNVSTKVDLSAPTGGNGSTAASYLVDGNKATAYNLYGDSAELVFNLTVNGQPTAIDHFALYYARNNDVNPKNVTIKIKKTADGEFETIYTGSTGFNTDGISVAGNKDSFFAAFDQTYFAYDLMLNLSGGGEELYLPEFELYAYERAEAEPEDIPLSAPTGLTATATTDSSITVTADAVTGGTLMFRIDGGKWQESGTFTGLTRNTPYTVDAMYVGAEGYTDSGVTSIEVTTGKTAQAAPTGLNATAKTDTSITVTADASANGTLQYRINGGEWQASGTFTGLTRNTHYTVEAMYVGINGYENSGVTSIEVTTNKTAQAAPAGLKATATTDSSITVTANTSANGTLQFRINGGEWKVGNTVTFDGLDRNTTYTVEAMYIGINGYANSAVTTNQFKTAKTQLSNPTGLISTEVTATSITVTANAIAGGTLQYRINGGQWQTSGSFTGLDNNTTYTVDAMYVAADGYIDSGIASLVVATTKPAVVNNGEYAYLEAIPENAVTPHVGYNNYSNHDMYAENTVNGDNINDAMYGTAAQIKGDNVTFTREDLQGQKRLSVVYDLNNGATKIGGVELTGKDGYNITKFLIQVKNGTGEWQTVRIITANPFTESDTVLFTFTPKEADKVRIMIEDYEENANNAPEICEMVVYEVKEDAAQVELPATAADSKVVDGNKATFASTNSVTLTLSKPGQVKRVKLFGYTDADSIGAYTVEIISGGNVVHTATGNAYGNARAFSTAIVELDQYYQADAVRITASGTAKIPEIELYGKLTPADPAPEDPTPATTPGATAPTEPTKPAVESPLATQAATQAATIPTEPAGMQQPTVAAPNVGNESGAVPTVPAPNVGDETGADPTIAAPDVPDESGDPEAPTAPVVTQKPTVAVSTTPVQIAVQSAVVGVYNDGTTRSNLTAQQSASAIIDGNTSSSVTVGTGSDDWIYNTSGFAGNGGNYTPAAILTLAKATTVNRVVLYPFNSSGTYSATDVTIQYLNGNSWTSVGSFEIESFSGPAEMTFTAVTTTQIRVLVDNIERTSSSVTAQWLPKEIQIYGYTVSSSDTYTPDVAGEQKISLSTDNWDGCNSEGYSADGADTKQDYESIDWYYSGSSGKEWSKVLDGDDSTEVHWNLGDGERGDFLLDLSNGGAGTDISGVRLYSGKNSSYMTPTSFELVLLLKDGTIKTVNFNTGWNNSTAAGTVCEYEFDNTYTVTGLYVWADSNDPGEGVTFGDIELYQKKTVTLDPPKVDWTSKNDTSITVTAAKIDASIGKLQFRINGGAWQDAVNGSYTFPNLTGNTTYTIDAQYYTNVDGYVTSAPGSVTVKTEETPATSFTVSGTTNAGATVKLYKDGNPVGGMETTAGNDGKYTFSNVPIGTYTVVVTLNGYYGDTAEVIVNDDVTAPEITLVKAAYTVSGATTAGATVKLYKDGAEKYTAAVNGTTYTFNNVPIGKYTLVATKDGYNYRTEVVTVNTVVSQDMTLTQAVYTVSGNTTAGATVKLYKNGAVVSTFAATGGTYSFSNVAIGNYTLVATLNGYNAKTQQITVNKAVSQDMTLTKAAYTVSGTVTGSTADTVTVQLYQNGVVKYTATVTPNGNDATYSFTNIPIGNYSLMVTKANHIAKSATVTVDKNLTDQNFTLTYVEPITSEVYTDAVVLAGYNIHLVEPWALRINLTFYTEKNGTAIDLSTFKSYGAYAIIAGEYGNGVPTTWQDIVNSPNATQFRMGDGTGAYDIYQKNATTAVFDFYDGLYTYRMAENVYWVAYYEDAAGNIHFTSVLKPVVIEKIDEIIGNSTSESEVRLLNSMKELHSALIAFRGENAELGKDYTNDEGVLNYNLGLGTPNTTDYQFGKSHRIRLIEPWGVLVSIQVKPRSGSVYTDTDFANADNYGMIFFHDEDLAYNGDMRADQILAMNDVYVYSKKLGNVVVEDGKMSAIYDKDLATSMLDSDVYCLPFVEVDGQYYYSKNAFRINLLDEMYVFYNRTNLSNNERNTFRKMIELYKNTILHFDK